jgi:hypothetical protein
MVLLSDGSLVSSFLQSNPQRSIKQPPSCITRYEIPNAEHVIDERERKREKEEEEG